MFVQHVCNKYCEPKTKKNALKKLPAHHCKYKEKMNRSFQFFGFFELKKVKYCYEGAKLFITFNKDPLCGISSTCKYNILQVSKLNTQKVFFLPRVPQMSLFLKFKHQRQSGEKERGSRSKILAKS